ncbi:UNVERIFIED_CONTAM: hypothetical protein ABIC26_002102 [Paenibacillus sp. PvR008]
MNEHPFELRHEVKRLNTRLDQVADMLEKVEFRDVLETYSNPQKRTRFPYGMACPYDVTSSNRNHKGRLPIMR